MISVVDTPGTALISSRNAAACDVEGANGVLTVSGQVQRQNRHIIDGTGFDDGLGGPRRKEVHVGKGFRVHPGHGFFGIGPDLKPKNEHGQPGLGGGIHIFHVGDFPKFPFPHRRQPIFHFPGAGAGIPHKHIKHRHIDLGFFFPGKRNVANTPNNKLLNTKRTVSLELTKVSANLGPPIRENGFSVCHWGFSKDADNAPKARLRPISPRRPTFAPVEDGVEARASNRNEFRPGQRLFGP
jgi:hypothetical protein